MKIAVVVPGRFHAFDLVRALRDRGHDVVLFTNYPKWAVRRFGVSPDWTRSFWVHGAVSRLFEWFTKRLGVPYPEPVLQPWFSRWARKALSKSRWDIVHLWSGVGEEILLAPERVSGVCLLMRGSSHIRTQARILEEERKRIGVPMDHPSNWMIGREEREYQLADRVIVLSSFAHATFLREGTPEKKVEMIPLGTDLKMFRPQANVVEERCRRILTGEPLRILYVGSLSFRKGLWDLGAIVRLLEEEKFRFKAVGPVPHESRRFLKQLGGRLEIVSKKPQNKLPDWYRWADLFLFPTLEDGYPVVLAQAQASGLPILTTTHCS